MQADENTASRPFHAPRQRQGGIRRTPVPAVLVERPDASNRRVPDVRTGGDAPGPKGGGSGRSRLGLGDDRPNAKRKRVQRRFRAWMCTENNPKADSAFLRAKQDGIEALGAAARFAVFQIEKGEEGTLHVQAYIEFTRPVSLDECKSFVGERTHCDRRFGTQKQAIKYCSKAETRVEGPWEVGTKQISGQRNDIDDLREAIKRGCISKERLLEDHGHCMARYPRFAQTCIDAYYKEGWRPVECWLLIGDTGLGKTRWVYDNWAKEGCFWRLPAISSSIWFDGYEGETHVLLDDFAGAASKVSLVMLLQMIDGYMCRLPNKGGFVGWKPTHIAITSNVHPNNWYKWTDRMNQYKALARRFTKIMEFVTIDDDVVVTEYTHEEFFTLK